MEFIITTDFDSCKLNEILIKRLERVYKEEHCLVKFMSYDKNSITYYAPDLKLGLMVDCDATEYANRLHYELNCFLSIV